MKYKDLEVEISGGPSKAIIEGKTMVPFKTFVALILQRKVTALFKDWGNDSVIVNSELLTSLASAPQDSRESHSQVVLVTLGVGILMGVFFLAVLQIGLSMFKVTLDPEQLWYIAGGLFALAVLVSILGRMKRKNRGEKMAENMEKLASLLGNR